MRKQKIKNNIARVEIYNGHQIPVMLQNGNVYINATEMAKIYDKDVPDFLMLKQTKEFIEECGKNQNSGFLGTDSGADLVISKQRTGTYMHRVLALKFAAWLNPSFELWVYRTIENLLFGDVRILTNSLRRQHEIDIKLRELNSQINVLMLEHKRLKKERQTLTESNYMQLGLDFTAVGSVELPKGLKTFHSENN